MYVIGQFNTLSHFTPGKRAHDSGTGLDVVAKRKICILIGVQSRVSFFSEMFVILMLYCVLFTLLASNMSSYM